MEPIVKEAYDWLGTPHVNQAKVKGRGIDCGMLLIACAEGAGWVKEGEVEVPPYSNEWQMHRSDEWFLHIMEQYCHEIPLTDIQPGDFLLYKYGRCVSHGAIYVGNGRVIHAVLEQGVIMSDINDVMFLTAKGESRLHGVYRYSGRR